MRKRSQLATGGQDARWLGPWFAEAVATFGCTAVARTATPYAVGLYITAAYWFTSSTSFANPAVTIGGLSDTFAGIALQKRAGVHLRAACGFRLAWVLQRQAG